MSKKMSDINSDNAPLPKAAIQSIKKFKESLKILVNAQQTTSKVTHDQSLASRDKKLQQDLTIARMMRDINASNTIQQQIKNIIKQQLMTLILNVQKKKKNKGGDENEKFLEELDEQEEEEQEEKLKQESEQAEALRLKEEMQAAQQELSTEMTSDLAQYFADIGAIMSQNMQLGEKDFTLFDEKDLDTFQQALLLKLSVDKPTPEAEKSMLDNVEKTLKNAFQKASDRFSKMQPMPAHGLSTLENCFKQVSKDVMNWLQMGQAPQLGGIQSIFRVLKQQEEALRAVASGSGQKNTSEPMSKTASAATSTRPLESPSSEKPSAQAPTQRQSASPFRIPQPGDKPRPKGSTDQNQG